MKKKSLAQQMQMQDKEFNEKFKSAKLLFEDSNKKFDNIRLFAILSLHEQERPHPHNHDSLSYIQQLHNKTGKMQLQFRSTKCISPNRLISNPSVHSSKSLRPVRVHTKISQQTFQEAKIPQNPVNDSQDQQCLQQGGSLW